MHWIEDGIQFDFKNIQGVDAGWGRFYTANVSVKRALLTRAGGFDEGRFPFHYEDLELAYRMHGFGFRLLYNRSAVVEHLHETTLEAYQRRMAEAAPMERRFVSKHPEFEPYFYRMFREASQARPVRGTGARLAAWVPRWVPWLGPRVWASADAYFRQRLAPSFLAAWDRAEKSET
jgi:hypothetical protein